MFEGVIPWLFIFIRRHQRQRYCRRLQRPHPNRFTAIWCRPRVSMEPGNLANREATRPSISEVTISKTADNSVTDFFRESVVGSAGKTAKFKFVQTGADKVVEYMNIDLFDTIISGYPSALLVTAIQWKASASASPKSKLTTTTSTRRTKTPTHNAWATIWLLLSQSNARWLNHFALKGLEIVLGFFRLEVLTRYLAPAVIWVLVNGMRQPKSHTVQIVFLHYFESCAPRFGFPAT